MSPGWPDLLSAMGKIFAAAVVGTAVCLATLGNTATATADPSLPDPHIPITERGYCPGNRAAEWTAYGRCDGWPYADGSFWRAAGIGFTKTSRACVVGNDFNVSPPHLAAAAARFRAVPSLCA